MGRTAAILVAVFLLAVAGFWLLRRAPSPAAPTESTEALPPAPTPGAPDTNAIKPGDKLTGPNDETFVFRPTAEPAPAKSAPAKPPADFEKMLKATQGSLPTQAQLGQLKSKEVHKTPKMIFEASGKIGDVAESIEKDPSLAPQGMTFYRNCARDSKLATSVRAHCLDNMRELGTQQNLAFDEEGVEPKVQALADKLKEK